MVAAISTLPRDDGFGRWLQPRRKFPRVYCAPHATGIPRAGVFPAVTKTPAMKNDLSFKFLSAVIIAGVILALVAPGQSALPTKARTDATMTHADARP
jgi:hypothetical protein